MEGALAIAFYTAAGVALIATVLTVTGRNPVHALLYLIVSLLAVDYRWRSPARNPAPPHPDGR
jgi:NADH:ubiquinone oxidoreductase subunit 6 (subunit J)